MKEEEGEGCNIHGSLEVNKVAGNFHFAPGKSFHQPHANLLDLLALQTESYNVRQCLISHYIWRHFLILTYLHPPFPPLCNLFLYSTF